MTQHDIAARAPNYVVCILAVIALVSLIAYSQTKDEADDKAVRAHVERQAKSAAQPDTWAKLDRDGRRMTGYDRIKK